MKFESWRPGLLPAVVRFWNRAFSGKRNFFPMTEELFLSRIVRKRTAVEGFDPEGFVVAREGGEVAGFVHVGVRTGQRSAHLGAGHFEHRDQRVQLAEQTLAVLGRVEVRVRIRFFLGA